jgi:hypothetical protein
MYVVSSTTHLARAILFDLIVHPSCGIPVPRDLAAENRKESLAHVDLYDNYEVIVMRVQGGVSNEKADKIILSI